MGSMLRDVAVDEYLKDCVELSPMAIEEEYIRWSGDFAYWAARFRDASKEALTAEGDLKRTEAFLYLKFREDAAAAKEKATEATIDAKIKTHDDYAQALTRKIEAEVDATNIKLNLDAMRGKKDMLVSMGAHVRQELQGDLRMRDRAAAERTERTGEF